MDFYVLSYLASCCLWWCRKLRKQADCMIWSRTKLVTSSILSKSIRHFCIQWSTPIFVAILATIRKTTIPRRFSLPICVTMRKIRNVTHTERNSVKLASSDVLINFTNFLRKRGESNCPQFLHCLCSPFNTSIMMSFSRHDRRKTSQMMASIEDSMAELADPGGQLLGGYILDQRRASRVSRRSHRSSVGGKGSNNGSDNEFRNSIQEFNQGLTTTTTTAEVTTCTYSDS